jgi:hypothetical protein
MPCTSRIEPLPPIAVTTFAAVVAACRKLFTPTLTADAVGVEFHAETTGMPALAAASIASAEGPGAIGCMMIRSGLSAMSWLIC